MKHFFLISILFLSLAACTSKETKKKAPAEVQAPVKESDLTTIKLTEKAESRLGIEIYKVEEKEMSEVFETGGQAIAPPGQSASIVSPLQGTLTVAGKEPIPGMEVKKGQVLYRIVILPSEKDLVNVRQEVASLTSQLENAKTQAARTAGLLKDGAVSVKQNELAQNNLAVTQQAYSDAQARFSLLRNGSSGNVPNSAKYAIEAPMDGIIQQVYAASGQAVTAGRPIIDIAAITSLWIQVPVYTGDVSTLNVLQKATIQKLGNTNTKNTTEATLATAPVTTAGSSLTNVFYEIKNESNAFMPGEKVNIFIPKGASKNAMAIPYEAVLYDYNGGEWVYVRTEPQTFVRTRIQIDHVTNGMAVITNGLSLGTEIVTKGAPELFGTEFNSGK